MPLKDRSKAELVAMMFKLAKSDKQLSDLELRFVYDMASRMDMDESEVSTIYEHVDAFDLNPPKTEQERMTMLYQLLFLMKIDNDIEEAERTFIHDMALKLGIRDSLTDKLINVMKRHLDDEVPPAEMMENIRAYLN